MKTILLYGDSNTWGQMAYGNRYPYKQRWSSILQEKLGSDYEVVSSGICGRTAGSYPNSEKRHRGDDAFEYAYLSSYPFSCIVIALGTSDLKAQFEASAQQIVDKLVWYQGEIDRLQSQDEKKFGRKTELKVIYILPPNFDTAKSPDRDDLKRQGVLNLFHASPYEFIEANDLEMSEDGIHFAASAHNRLADLVYLKLKEVA